MKKDVLTFIKILCFNLSEAVIIFLLGEIFHVAISLRIVLMVLFFLTRMIIGKPKHYNKAYRCMIWSTLVFVSLYTLSTLDLFAIIVLTIFTAFISTGKADIQDMFMWGGNKLNNNVYDWVKFNQDNEKLKQYEEKLKETDKKKYFIFIYRFREFKSYSEISRIMDVDIQRICDEVNIISHFIEYSIRLEGE